MRGFAHLPVTVRDRTLRIKVNDIETPVRFRVSSETPPTRRIERVGWSQNFEYVGIAVFGVYYKNAASIIWTTGHSSKSTGQIEKYGWSISSEPELWDSVNTLGHKGKRWVYEHPDACMMGLIKYVVQCLVTGNLEWK